MTSIVKASPTRNIYEQVKWKSKAYSATFSSVLIVHILFGLMMLGNGSGSRYSGSGAININYEEHFYSLDAMYYISLITMFMIGWLIASKAISRDNFSILTNNQTEVISSLSFLVVLCIFTFLSALSTLSITVFIHLIRSDGMLLIPSTWMSFQSVLIFLTSTILAGTVGYCARSLFDFSKAIFVLVIVVLISVVRAISVVELWPLLFGEGWLEIGGRSVLYIIILWIGTILLRQRKEVIRG